MPLYAESEKQKERQAFVHQEVEKEKTLQEDLVRQQGEKLVDDSQLQQDAVSLGQKKTYKPNDEQKRRNARIDKAQKETGLKKATADTKRLHDIINADDITLLGTEDEQLYLLRSTEFKPRMLTSSNIRAHFAEYMQLIKYYRHLDELAAKDQRLKERLDSIKENMEILIQRMDVFCSKNRLHLDGRRGDFIEFPITKDTQKNVKALLQDYAKAGGDIADYRIVQGNGIYTVFLAE